MIKGAWRRREINRAPEPVRSSKPERRLRPLDGTSGLVIGHDGTIMAEAPAGESIPILWSIRTDDRWRRLETVQPRIAANGIGAVIISVDAGEGEIRFVVSAGVSGGAPVGVIEVTNATPNPIAIGADAETPSATHLKDGTYWVEDRPLLTSWLRPRPTPDVDDVGHEPALIVPLPHMATARFSIPLATDAPWIATPGRQIAAVPTVEDIERGWQAHLERGMRFEIAGEDRWAQSIKPFLHKILTAAPDETRLDDVTAAALYGFVLPVAHVLGAVENSDASPAAILTAVGTWNRLDDPATGAWEEGRERLIVAVAKAAHHIARAGQVDPVPAGAGGRCMAQLAQSMRSVDQPDVAERVASLAALFDTAASSVSPPSLATLDEWRLAAGERTRNDHRNDDDHSIRARYLLGLRERLVDSRCADVVALLTDLAPPWRGRSIEVFNAPVGPAMLSYGLRWHGPRPAVLWSMDETPLGAAPKLRMPAIDPMWATSESTGEALLADPGWTKR